ncbi:hypothetical protein EMPS_11005 [Entomortierella parvispora]|uniref:Mediator of RNA polymerase II transcription subunit 19 n=1 Tax=Entomortierella parvispora TaxID=205924 RepID=A0A9P3HL43_9FUNG|nr:hypothetical protein EMPS_11005 [Entomortierella parvispora]
MADSSDTATNADAVSSSPKLYYVKEARANATTQALTASQDLMTAFHLLPLYNQYVKQRLENNDPVPPIEPSYFPYISDLPGKNIIRPGNYIRTLLETPEKSYGPIHGFSSSTLRDGFSLRPGPVPGFDSSVLGTEEDSAYKQSMRNSSTPGPALSDPLKLNATGGQGYNPGNMATPSTDSPAHQGQGHHHSSHHSRSHLHGSKSSTSSPHINREERTEDGSREHKHKKKKKKRKHEHDHEHSHHEGEGDSEHRKKKKRKKEREEPGEIIVD